MRKFIGAIACLAVASASQAIQFTFDSQADHQDILGDGKIWLRTMTPVYDPSTPEKKEETYKVFTHIYDFAGKGLLTKGAGGLYTHHRGLFIGWRDTIVQGKHVDTWVMANPGESSIRHVAWLEQKGDASTASQNEELQWCDMDGKPFIKEFRTIAVKEGDKGVRIIDFVSTLHSLAGKIELKGDLQHAGMQLRLADEVNDHQKTTQYVLPDGAQEVIEKDGKSDDRVVGAWWVMCSAEILGKRYWVQHMTAPDLVTGIPVYSIRRYGRFGSFFEPVLEEGKPLVLRFRIVVSETELTKERCAAMYDAYTKEAPLVKP